MSEIPETYLRSLTPQTDAAGEVFNLHEDGSVKKGQLRRWLKMFAPKFDELKGLLEGIRVMIDIDHTDEKTLPLIAKIVGVDFNREIPLPQARQEVKDAVPWYKRKGTTVGCRIHGFKITRLQTDIEEFVFRIRTSGRTYSFSANPWEDNQALLHGLPGDKTAYSYDFDYKSVLTLAGSNASSELAGHDAWRAQDKSEATSWKGNATPQTWWHDFTDTILPVRVRIKAGMGLRDWTLVWSDNGIDWVPHDSFTYGDIQSLTQFAGTATGGTDAFVITNIPIVKTPAHSMFEMTGYAGGDSTLLSVVSRGDTQIAVASGGGFEIGDWLEIHVAGGEYGFYQIEAVSGGSLTLTTPIVSREDYPALLTTVKEIDALLKTETTDYTLDLPTGVVGLVAGQFTPGNRVFLGFNALLDKKSLGVWQDYSITIDWVSAHRYWGVRVDSTWVEFDDVEIFGLEMMEDQFWGTYYRCDRLGYFFTLGNSRPGCGELLVCNKALTEETVNKLCATMATAVPACIVPVMTFVDCRYIDTVNGSISINDVGLDELHTRNPETAYLSQFVNEHAYDIVCSRLLVSGDIDRGSYPMVNACGDLFVSAIGP